MLEQLNQHEHKTIPAESNPGATLYFEMSPILFWTSNDEPCTIGQEIEPNLATLPSNRF
ncbi:unnamed protein product [Boreogadus saida]